MPLRVGDRVPHLDEDSLHEFKMHTKIAIEEVPRKCSVNDKGKIVRTMQPASKTISAMLNTEGGRIYLGITDDGVIEGLVLNDSQTADSAPTPAPCPPPRRRSRAWTLHQGFGSSIEKIEEEPSDEEKRKSSTESLPTKATEDDSEKPGQASQEEPAQPTPSASDTSSSTTTNAETAKPIEKEDYFYVHKNAEATDPIEEYYRRNKNQLTVTSMYEKSTEMRRLPEYLKQMRAKNHAATIRSRMSRRSGFSGSRSTRSRTGLPQVPEDQESNKFMRSFYYLASKHRKIGFRHIFMLAVVTTYALIGATMFYHIESPNEIKTLRETKIKLTEAISTIAHDLRVAAHASNETLDELVKNAYIRLINIDGKYAASTYDKLSTGEDTPKLTWTFGSAFFFSVTVFTTIGYGSIAPITVMGKACVIVYGFICVPLTMVVLRDIGQFVLVTLTKIYARLLIKLRTARGYTWSDNESISLPIKFCSLLSVSYVLSAAVFIYNFDAIMGPPETGMDLFHALYFSFISITTIGLGDVMPNNATFSPVIAIVLFLGLPIMRVVNRVSYVALENGVFGTMAMVEHRIDVKMGAVAPARATSSVSQGPDPEDLESGKSASVISQHDGRVAAMATRNADEYSTYDDDEDDEAEDAGVRNEVLNNFTVHSIAAFMRARSDVYGGDFGRVNIRKGDL